MRVEPWIVVVLETLKERVARRGEEDGMFRWWDGKTEMDGCRGLVGAMHEERLELGQGRCWVGQEMHVILWYCLVHDINHMGLSLLSLSTSHVCPLYSLVYGRTRARLCPGNRSVYPSPVACPSHRPCQYPHIHDQAGPREQVRHLLSPSLAISHHPLGMHCSSFKIAVSAF